MFLQNLRYSLRGMLKNSTFTIFLLIALATGTGVNTAIFSMVDSALIQPLPFQDPDHLVWIWSTRTDRAKAFFSIPDFSDVRSENQSLKEMVAFANWSGRLKENVESERVQGVRITTNAFRM